MKVIDILAQRDGRVVSVEIEPLKVGEDIEKLWTKLDPYVELGISWVDITIHAQRIVGRQKLNGHMQPIYERYKPATAAIAGRIEERYRARGVLSVPHTICTGFNKYETAEYLENLRFLGIKNTLAVRGDGIKELIDGQWVQHPFEQELHGHSGSNGLMEQIRAMRQGVYVGATQGTAYDFCIGGGCYPDGYCFDTASALEPLEEQVQRLQQKCATGLVDYLVTQMFFDNKAFLQFRDLLEKARIAVPLIPGVMPLYARRNLEALQSPAFHCAIPPSLAERVLASPETESGNSDVKAIGVEWCLAQIEELYREGVPSVHLYATRGAPIKNVLENLPFTPAGSVLQ